MKKKQNDGVFNLHGREYFSVARRVHDFRAAYPISSGWGIITDLVSAEEAVVCFKATIIDPEGRVVAVGFAEERRSNRGVNSTSAIENAETSAVGRALAAAGFGGSGQYASADEVLLARAEQGAQKASQRAPAPLKVASQTDRDWAADRVEFEKAITSKGLTLSLIVEYCSAKGWGHPKEWPNHKRNKFLLSLENGVFTDLYTRGKK
jgi:hypothetical protein